MAAYDAPKRKITEFPSNPPADRVKCPEENNHDLWKADDFGYSNDGRPQTCI